MPQLQNNVTAALPGTPIASYTPAVAGMGRQGDFSKGAVAILIPVSREVDIS